MLLLSAALAFGVGCAMKPGWVSMLLAAFTGALILPALVLYEEFFVPYKGGGASFWPIAIVLGGMYGLMAALPGAALGRLIAHLRERWR
jgi:hypothetical protein